MTDMCGQFHYLEALVIEKRRILVDIDNTNAKGNANAMPRQHRMMIPILLLHAKAFATKMRRK